MVGLIEKYALPWRALLGELIFVDGCCPNDALENQLIFMFDFFLALACREVRLRQDRLEEACIHFLVSGLRGRISTMLALIQRLTVLGVASANTHHEGDE